MIDSSNDLHRHVEEKAKIIKKKISGLFLKTTKFSECRTFVQKQNNKFDINSILFMDVTNKVPNLLLQLIGFVFVLVTVFDLTTSGKFCFFLPIYLCHSLTSASLRHMIFPFLSSSAYFLVQNKVEKKLCLSQFPFTHSDESRKEEAASSERKIG